MRLIIIGFIVCTLFAAGCYYTSKNTHSIVSASDIVSDEKLILDPDIFMEESSITAFTETGEAELVYLIFGRSICRSCNLLLEAIQNSSSIRNI